MKLEYWLAIVSIGLSLMFVCYVLSFYNYLKFQQKETERFVDIDGVLLKAISISAAPCLVLSGVVFGLLRSYGAKIPGLLLLTSGMIMVTGMIYLYFLTITISQDYKSIIIDTMPFMFIVVGFLISLMGLYLFFKSQKISSMPDSTLIKGR